MPSDEEVEAVALAIKECTDKFESPVAYYIEPEAQFRWMNANPGRNFWDEASIDDLESYRIIARAALEAAERVRNHRGQPSSSTAIEPPGRSSQPE